MQYKSNKGFSGWGQLGILLVLIGGGLTVGGLVQSVLITHLIPSNTPKEKMLVLLREAMQDPKNSDWIRWMQTTSTFLSFFVPAVCFSIICNGKKMIWLGFSKHINLFQILLGFLIIFTANILASPLQQLTEKIVSYYPALKNYSNALEVDYSQNVKAMMSNINQPTDLLISLIILALLPALFEEVLFRGALQNIFVKWWKKPMLAIIITSFIFSAIHLSVNLLLSRLVLGLALGLIYHETRNIWVNVIAHFLNNAFAVGQFYVISKQHPNVNLSEMDAVVPWWTGLVAVVVLIFLLKLLAKYSNNNKMRIYSREQALMAGFPSGNPLA